MPIGRLSDGSWDHDSCRVDCLPDVVPVDATGHFLDQDWGELLGSERSVYAQEIDLSHEHLLSVNINMDWNARYEAEQLVLLASSYAKQPILFVAWWCQCPLQELY